MISVVPSLFPNLVSHISESTVQGEGLKGRKLPGREISGWWGVERRGSPLLWHCMGDAGWACSPLLQPSPVEKSLHPVRCGLRCSSTLAPSQGKP